jgi:hypothetical protein
MSDHNMPDDANADKGATGAQPTQAPQLPTPVPSVRLSVHTVTPPIPARQTSITASDTGSFTLRSPFTFGGFGPSTLPDGDARRQSDAIRQLLEDAYKLSRSDGSRFGSIRGSHLNARQASHTPLPTTSQLVRDQQGIGDPSLLWDETDVNFPPLPSVAPIRRDSEDSRAADFVGEDLTTNADYQPENLQSTHSQQNHPDIQAQSDVHADVHGPAATGAEFLAPAGQTAASQEQTIEEKIQTFHISDDQPSGQSQTATPAQNPERKIAKKTYDTQKGSVTRLINKF